LTSHDGLRTCYPALAGYERSGDEHRIRLADERLALAIDLGLQVHPGEDVVEQWTEIRHGQPGPVTLYAAAAAAPAGSRSGSAGPRRAGPSHRCALAVRRHPRARGRSPGLHWPVG
jgi:hypothetical protein